MLVCMYCKMFWRILNSFNIFPISKIFVVLFWWRNSEMLVIHRYIIEYWIEICFEICTGLDRLHMVAISLALNDFRHFPVKTISGHPGWYAVGMTYWPVISNIVEKCFRSDIEKEKLVQALFEESKLKVWFCNAIQTQWTKMGDLIWKILK